MKLSAPKKIVWLIALILAVLAVIVKLVPGARDLVPPIILKYDFWVMTVAYALLFLGTTLKGF